MHPCPRFAVWVICSEMVSKAKIPKNEHMVLYPLWGQGWHSSLRSRPSCLKKEHCSLPLLGAYMATSQKELPLLLMFTITRHSFVPPCLHYMPPASRDQLTKMDTSAHSYNHKLKRRQTYLSVHGYPCHR